MRSATRRAGCGHSLTATGRARGDLTALVAARSFEHSLDYAFLGLLVFGCYGIRSQNAIGAPG